MRCVIAEVRDLHCELPVQKSQKNVSEDLTRSHQPD